MEKKYIVKHGGYSKTALSVAWNAFFCTKQTNMLPYNWAFNNFKINVWTDETSDGTDQIPRSYLGDLCGLANDKISTGSTIWIQEIYIFSLLMVKQS